MDSKKARIRELDKRQRQLMYLARDLKCEATAVLLERSELVRELEALRREVFIHEKGITKISTKETKDYNNKKITNLLNQMTGEDLKNLVELLQKGM